MNKPIIGVMPLFDSEKESYWMLPGYMEGIMAAGGIPIMLPFTNNQQEVDRLAELCDGFLFTGGQDIEPSLYSEEKATTCGEICEARDTTESLFFQKALEADKPCLGICRGLQFFNVALGGKLYQDIPSEKASEVVHRQQHPYDQPIHKVELIAGSGLEQLVKVPTLSVNSLHHQGIKALGDGLQPMAIAPDGLVEAIEMPLRKFVWAVQWHPEFNFQKDTASKAIFEEFIRHCITK